MRTVKVRQYKTKKKQKKIARAISEYLWNREVERMDKDYQEYQKIIDMKLEEYAKLTNNCDR